MHLFESVLSLVEKFESSLLENFSLKNIDSHKKDENESDHIKLKTAQNYPSKSQTPSVHLNNHAIHD